jgi:uncharacterized membrane protein
MRPIGPGGGLPQAHAEQGGTLPPAGATGGKAPRRTIWSILVGVALVGLVLLLPDLTPAVSGGDSTVTAYHGRIDSIVEPSGGSDPDSPPVTVAKVTYLEGPLAGQTADAYLVGPGGAQSVADYKPGDEVVVTISTSPDADAPFISVSDRWRLPILGWLVGLFALAVVVVGGWHGVRALIALGLTIAVIVKVLLPLIIAGYPPVTLAVVTASGVTVLTILMTEGLKRSSLAAILGTTGALAITGLLAAAATAALGFTYIAGSDLAFFTLPDGRGLDLRGVLLAAMILGAVGVLDDVTVTQAVLVDELASAGRIDGSHLVVRAMTVGRSHIAATVNTLFLAYVGAGLPLLVVLLVSRQPAALVFNDEVIVTEIVRTLVGSLGIVAAIPLTTFIASALRGSAPRQAGWSEATPSRLSRVAVVSLIIVVLLGLTAVLPITSGSRAPMTADRFDPSLLPGGNADSPPPTGSNAPAASDADITVVGVGEPTPITIDGADVGSVMVASWSFGSDASDRSIEIDVHYEASARFSLSSGTWALLFPDGSELALLPADDPEALDRTLESGAQADVTLVADGLPPQDPSVVYLDASTGDFVFGVPLT